MDELKPCPFCGNQMEGYPDYTISFKRDKKKRLGIYHEICTLHCNHCGCAIQQAGATREKAEEYVLKAWNRRTEPQWIPCSERLPARIINGDVETEQEFFVTVRERWPGEEWKYYTDVAFFPGYYIDDLWDTYNDWKEGQEVNVTAWKPLPEPYNPDDFSQHMNPPED